MRKIFLLFIFFSLLFSYHVQAQQQDVVPPAGATTVGGSTFSGGPLGTSARTFQWLINESQLTNVIGRQITAITFRLSNAENLTGWPVSDMTYSDYDIYLSGSVTPASRSLTFVNNIVGAQTQVRSGSLLIGTGDFPGGPEGLKAFGSSIEFNTPYLYQGGHLLVEIRHSSATGTNISPDAVAATGGSIAGYGTDFSSCQSTSYTGTSGSQSNFVIMQLVSQDTGPCTAPPTPGIAESNKTNVCTGENFNLTLSGNSTGSGQTYQWQSSLTGNAPWTDVGTVGTAPSVSFTQTATTWYRSAVTCGSDTEYSDSIEISTPELIKGSFTINNAGGGDFQSFADAIDYIKCGIDSAVVFNVEPGSGPYIITEPIVIPQIFGTSASNNIKFKGNGATISYNTSTSASRTALILQGADHIIIDSLIIDVSAGTYGWGIALTGQADSNIIRKNTILSSTSSTSSNYAGIVINGSVTGTASSGNNGNGNLVDSNIIKGGYYGVYVYGSSTANNLNNIISNNIIEDFYGNGVYAIYQTGLTIKNNDISRPARTSTVAGSTGMISLNTNSIGAVIDGNKIHNLLGGDPSSTTILYGIYAAADGTASEPNRIINNLIYGIEGNGSFYGLYNSGAAYMLAYHNTFALDYVAATAGTTYGFYQTTSDDGIEFRNNIMYITRGGSGAKYGIYKSTAATPLVSDNNVFYLNSAGSGAQNVGYQSSAQPGLADWQTMSGQDANSIVIDPLFTSPGSDYTPTEPSINDIAPDLGVATDITGAARGTSPDPGAYEFSLPGCTNPPTAGDVVPSVTIACAGELFNLDLTGHSVGDGILYYWESSPDGNAPWTSIATPQTITQLSGISQTATTWYRGGVECNGGGIVYNLTPVQVVSPALVSDTFTINNNLPTDGSNFASFADAVNHIKCGIDGAVVFIVEPASGPYTEQVIIPEIFGTSAANTITFNGNGAILTYTSSSTTERAVLKLNGADNIIIDSLHIIAGGSATTEYSYGIQLVNNADHNTIKNSTIDATLTPATAASTAFAGIVINSATATTPVATGVSECDSNTVINNTVTGGYAGIALTANGATSVITGNQVLNNIVKDAYLYGIYLNGNENTLVEGNDVSRPTRTSVGNFNGVYIGGASPNTVVTKNKFHNPFDAALASTSGAYGVNISSADATAGNETIVSNNWVYNFNGNGIQNGFLNTGSAYILYYHNSVSLEDPSSTAGDTRGFYQTTAAAGIEFKNNTVKIARAGTGAKQCIFFNTPASSITSDYNNFYITSTGGTTNVIGYVSGSTHADLLAWQTASSQDANSWSVDPQYVALDDLHLLSSSPLDDKGTPVASVSVDIDSEARSLSTPDIGADELPPVAGRDIKPEALVSIEESPAGCYNVETVAVRIKNNSTNPIDFSINDVMVTVNVSGATTAAYSAIVNTGTLASGATLDVTMASPATLDMNTTGVYDFTITTAVTGGDVNSANDVLNVQREKIGLTGGIASVSPDNYCVTGGTPTLTATDADGYSSLQWQQSTGTGFTNIGGATTNPFIVAAPITQTTYYRLLAVCGTNEAPSAEAEVILSNPQITSTTPGLTCGTGTVNLSAAGTGVEINWYENPTGGTVVATGNNFTTPVINSTTTYYVTASEGGNTISTAKLAPDPSASATTLSTYPSIFTLTEPIVLNSVQVFSGTGTAITINLYNAAGTGTPLETTGSSAVTAGSSPTINLGWSIPSGTYRIVATMTGSFFRDGITTPSVVYPIALGSVGNINGYASSLTGTVATGAAYYFLYNWSITTGCESSRVAVTATVDNDPGCTLPVTLLSFTGKNEGAVNLLQWQTATESNNAGFELQRSADGRNFSKLSFINSKAEGGNSTTALNYNFNDKKPFAGNNYYRLKQIDKDGKFSYSNVVLLSRKVTEITLTSVYPNPTERELNLVITSPKSEKVMIVVTDLTGKVVMQRSTQVVIGDNQEKLNVQRLSAGTYIIKAVCANGCEIAVHRFVKQ